MYTNFDCNLACDYCCARSGPAADKRRFPVDLAADAVTQFAAQGGRELLLTGGEPFLHPELDRLAALVPEHVTLTILTNAMVVGRGRRRAMLESLDRRRVVLQVSLDSADDVLHDLHRGPGSHARTMAGIGLVSGLGFRIRVAATVRDSSPRATAALHDRLEDLGVKIGDRLIRPVAEQGFADDGVQVTLDNLAPEPTLTVDGAWWHPVAVTDPAMRVSDHPLPLEDALATIADTVAVQDRARAEGRRHVFRCT
jgi:sulfatase maturation enzyme AslB (radical SAM superfamily)